MNKNMLLVVDLSKYYDQRLIIDSYMVLILEPDDRDFFYEIFSESAIDRNHKSN